MKSPRHIAGFTCFLTKCFRRILIELLLPLKIQGKMDYCTQTRTKIFGRFFVSFFV